MACACALSRRRRIPCARGGILDKEVLQDCPQLVRKSEQKRTGGLDLLTAEVTLDFTTRRTVSKWAHKLAMRWGLTAGDMADMPDSRDGGDREGGN